jgi:hypothetical protein
VELFSRWYSSREKIHDGLSTNGKGGESSLEPFQIKLPRQKLNGVTDKVQKTAPRSNGGLGVAHA